MDKLSHGTERLNCNIFVDCLTSHLVPSSGQSFDVYNTLVYDHKMNDVFVSLSSALCPKSLVHFSSLHIRRAAFLCQKLRMVTKEPFRAILVFRYRSIEEPRSLIRLSNTSEASFLVVCTHNSQGHR